MTPFRVEVGLSFPDADPIYVDAQTRLLRQDMTALGFEPTIVAIPTPSGARGTAELLGVIQLLLLPTLGPKLFDLLQLWVSNRTNSTLKLKVNDGARSVELEYNPANTTWQDIDMLLASAATHIIEH